MYGRNLAGVWDLFYGTGRGKDYPGEAAEVARIILDRSPRAASVLDVACGTGEHLSTLRTLLPDAEGLDASAAMLEVARAKLPRTALHTADMRAFDLGRRFDAVICLNTGVAYLPSLGEFAGALTTMARHLNDGGVIVIEPWWFRDRFLDGYVAMDTVRGPDRCVSRTSLTRARSGSAHMEIHYVVADDQGIEHFTETHVFGLWTKQEYLAAFQDAGLDAEYRDESLSGYGMFVAGRR
jgi:SAM-dependent methyltransferase